MLLDDNASLWMSLGDTALVAENGCELMIHVRHEKVQ